MSNTKTVLWIETEEIVVRNIGLTIGEHITQEEANDLLEIMKGDVDCFEQYTPEYCKIQKHLDRAIIGGGEFSNVKIYTKEEK